jgi:hypothetical protein
MANSRPATLRRPCNSGTRSSSSTAPKLPGVGLAGYSTPECVWGGVSRQVPHFLGVRHSLLHLL